MSETPPADGRGGSRSPVSLTRKAYNRPCVLAEPLPILPASTVYMRRDREISVRSGAKRVRRVQVRCGFDACPEHGLTSPAYRQKYAAHKQAFEAVGTAPKPVDSSFFTTGWLTVAEETDSEDDGPPASKKARTEEREAVDAPECYEDEEELEQHVGRVVSESMHARLRALPTCFNYDSEEAESLATVSGKTVLFFLELQSANHGTSCWLKPVFDNAPRCVSDRVRVVTRPFASRLELLATACNVLPRLAGRGNKVWVCLVTSASEDGQMFNCTPGELAGPPSKPNEWGELRWMRTNEEFCSVYDFVQVVQGCLDAGNELTGIHLAAPHALRFTRTEHREHPVDWEWWGNELACTVTGHRQPVSVDTRSAVVAILAAAAARHRGPPSSWAATVTAATNARAKGLCTAAGVSCMDAAAKNPVAGPAARVAGASAAQKKKKVRGLRAAAAAAAADVGGGGGGSGDAGAGGDKAETRFLAVCSKAACRRLRAVVEALRTSVDSRADLPRVEFCIVDVEADDLSAAIMRETQAGDSLLVLTDGRAPLDDALRDLPDAMTVGPLCGQTTPWAIPHACTPCCADDAAAGACPDACPCGEKFLKTCVALYMAVHKQVREGVDLEQVQAYMCENAPGFVV